MKYQLIPIKENTESNTTNRHFEENQTLPLKSAEKLSKTPELSHVINSQEEHNPTPNAEYNEHDKLLTLRSSNLTSGSETLSSKDLSNYGGKKHALCMVTLPYIPPHLRNTSDTPKQEPWCRDPNKQTKISTKTVKREPWCCDQNNLRTLQPNA